ncbi:twin-arginine translocase subunit TatC [Maribacter chungangensis]|uniref:Sec-independent protein translocase protein TatC n=1 Tax=Maribacter chungangensis TaxID=1069117 RepID=A0ABW3B4N0_9FLAO
MGAKTTTPPNEMSFLDHLEELRWHLIRSTMAVIIIGIVAFVFSGFVFDVIIFGPSKMDFPTYRFFCKAATWIGIESDFCKDELPFTIQSRTMGGQFSADIWTAIWSGIILGFPYILYELWKFISPGLYEKERKHSKGFIFIASLLFFLGVLFGYYVVAPLSINFLGTYQVSEIVLNEFDLDSYIGSVRTSVLACGVLFELPIIIYFLTKVGLVTPDIMKKYRKIALVIVLILSAVITPPDVTSQIIVAFPVLILYQISIGISKRVLKNEAKKERKAKEKAQKEKERAAKARAEKEKADKENTDIRPK